MDAAECADDNAAKISTNIDTNKTPSGAPRYSKRLVMQILYSTRLTLFCEPLDSDNHGTGWIATTFFLTDA